MLSFNDLLQSPRGLKAMVVGGAVLAALVVGLLSAPAIVRGKVAREAAARGFEAEVESVGFGWRGVWLRGVRITCAGSEFEAHFEAIALGPLSGTVTVGGGRVTGKGDPAPLIAKLRGSGGTSGAGSASERELAADGIYVRWERDGAVLEGFGARAARRGGHWVLGADLARASAGERSILARGVAVDLATQGGRRQLVGLETKTVELTLRAAERALPSASPMAAKQAAPRGPPEESDGPSRAARLRAWRELVLPLVRDGLANGAHLALSDFSARVERAGETLSFGPSRLLLTRDQESVQLTLSPSAADAGATPLALNVTFPLQPGVTHVVAKGGPVSWSSLGVRDGQLGLRNVQQATLAVDGVGDLSEDFETVELDGKLSVRGLTLQRRELSPQAVGPVSFDAALKAQARTDGTALTISSSEAHLGEVRAELSAQIEASPQMRGLEGRLRVPLSGCQSVLDAMPQGLLPLVHGVRLSGGFGIDFQVRYASTAPQDTRVALSVQNDCKVLAAPPELSPHRFERAFLREVKAPDGSAMTIETGPGTSNWVSIDDMSKHLETAVLICEDSRFHAHAGFDFRALEGAIKDDLMQGRFARGASTVSMQLAKNLYLGKEKTLGRKLQEALLTMLLEQQLDKRRILELYLNVVELGPGLYGVGDAAQYYFATPARSLTLGQSLYLATLLPNPTYSRFGPDGKLNAGWLNYLHRLMHIAHKIKRIDDTELQAALEEEVAFRVPGTPSAMPTPSGDYADPSDPPALPEVGDEPR